MLYHLRDAELCGYVVAFLRPDTEWTPTSQRCTIRSKRSSIKDALWRYGVATIGDRLTLTTLRL